MRAYIELLAFQRGAIRETDLPRRDWLRTFLLGASDQILERIFTRTQNDFQPNPARCSSSSGDIIHIANRSYLIRGIGFDEITPKQAQKLREISDRERIQTYFGVGAYRNPTLLNRVTGAYWKRGRWWNRVLTAR